MCCAAVIVVVVSLVGMRIVLQLCVCVMPAYPPYQVILDGVTGVSTVTGFGYSGRLLVGFFLIIVPLCPVPLKLKQVLSYVEPSTHPLCSLVNRFLVLL